MIRVLVVSDIRLYREGLAAMLARDERIEIVGTEALADRAVEAVGEVAPEVVLVDMGMPDALISVQRIAARFPQPRIVALGVSEGQKDVIACAEAGAVGYVGRNSSLEGLVSTVEAALRGELHCSPKVAAALVQRIARLATRVNVGKNVHLTPRETEVAGLLRGGRTNQEIARDLHLEVSTVKVHVHNIFEKLGVHNRTEAAARLHAVELLQPRRPWVPSRAD